MSWSESSGVKLHEFKYPPPTLSNGAGAQSGIRAEVDASANQTLPKPYIQLAARLSQVWLNYWTILLLLVLFRLLFAARHLKSDLAKGVSELSVACNELQVASSTAVSMPHYLAKGTNSLLKHTIDGAVTGVSYVVQGLLTAVEEIVIFIVDTFKSTYICLLNLAVTGSLDAVADAVETVAKYVNETLIAITSDISSGITDTNKVLNKLSSLVEKAASFLGETIDIPTVDIPQISELSKVVIPTSFDTDLEKLKDGVNLDAVENATNAVIRIPFEKLKVLVSANFANYSFDQNVLSVPPTEQLTFCSEAGVAKTFVDIEKAVLVTYHVLIVLLILGAFLAMVPQAWLEWWKWKSLVSGTSTTFSAIHRDTIADEVDLVIVASRPIESLLGLTVATRFASRRSKNLARWYVAYVTHEPATIVLLLALAGLLACALQSLMLLSVTDGSPAVSKAAGNVSGIVHSKLMNTSAVWAEKTNQQLNLTQAELNKDLFGWVETSTTAVNDTLNTFTDELVGTLNSTFGGTILYTPILKVLDCIILLKLQGIEDALTWVHDKAHITLPAVPSAVFAISQSDAQSMYGENTPSTSGQVKKILDNLIKVWRTSIKQEFYIAGSLFLAWLLVAIGGLVRVWRDHHRSTQSAIALSQCFRQDVKACISRPKQDPAEARFAIDESRERPGPRTMHASFEDNDIDDAATLADGASEEKHEFQRVGNVAFSSVSLNSPRFIQSTYGELGT